MEIILNLTKFKNSYFQIIFTDGGGWFNLYLVRFCFYKAVDFAVILATKENFTFFSSEQHYSDDHQSWYFDKEH